MYPSLSAMKMTLLSSNREAKTCSRLLTLRHCRRLSKSTCSSRESTGRHRVSSYKHTHKSYYSELQHDCAAGSIDQTQIQGPGFDPEIGLLSV